MVVGDIVNGVFPNLGADVSFQPAGTNQIAILSTGTNGGNLYLSNGVTTSIILSANSPWTNANMKLLINNTNYLMIGPSGNNMAYSGIQLK